MNPEIKSEWINRLTNGERKQGRSFLVNKTDETYCCLGVLCEMAEEAGVIASTTKQAADVSDRSRTVEVADFDSYHAIMPQEVVAWAGLDAGTFGAVGYIAGSGGGSLAGMNDNGESFEAIAKVIEEKL